MSMDLVWDHPRQFEVVNQLTDRADLSLQDHHHPVGHGKPMAMNAPPPSPQEPSKLDTIFAQSLPAPLRSDTILVNEHQNPIAVHMHADMLDQLLRQAASHRNGRNRFGGGDPGKPRKRYLKKTSAATILRRRAWTAAHHVEKPSRIPITSARLRARTAAAKASDDLADAIAMVNLS